MSYTVREADSTLFLVSLLLPCSFCTVPSDASTMVRNCIDCLVRVGLNPSVLSTLSSVLPVFFILPSPSTLVSFCFLSPMLLPLLLPPLLLPGLLTAAAWVDDLSSSVPWGSRAFPGIASQVSFFSFIDFIASFKAVFTSARRVSVTAGTTCLYLQVGLSHFPKT